MSSWHAFSTSNAQPYTTTYLLGFTLCSLPAFVRRSYTAPSHPPILGFAPLLELVRSHPFPFGSDRNSLLRAFRALKWEARPLQPMSSVDAKGSMWLVQATEDPPDSILSMGHGDVVVLSGGAARSVGELCSKSSMPSLEIGGVTHHAVLPAPAQTRGFPHPGFLTGVRLFAMNKVTPAPFDQLLEGHIVLLCPSLYPLFLCPTFYATRNWVFPARGIAAGALTVWPLASAMLELDFRSCFWLGDFAFRNHSLISLPSWYRFS